MNRRLSLPVFGLPALLAACNPNEPWVPSLREQLTGADYAVYSAWLVAAAAGQSGPVLVDHKTTSVGYAGGALFQAMPSYYGSASYGQYTATPTDVPARLRGPGDEAIQDLLVQQELSLPLQPLFAGAEYLLVSDPVAPALQSRARVALLFSRVGFDRHARVARFDVTQSSPDEWGWPGTVIRYAVWAENTSGRWELVEVRQVPRSGEQVAARCDPPPQPPPPPGSTVTTGCPATPVVVTPPAYPVPPPCRVTRVRNLLLCIRTDP